VLDLTQPSVLDGLKLGQNLSFFFKEQTIE
jgi:hypothetical protein